MSPSEEYRKRLEENKKKAAQKGQGQGQQKPQEEPFVEMATMYKLSDAFGGEGLIKTVMPPRKLECVNCGNQIEWRIYWVAPEVFDRACPECGVDAETYWKNIPHRKVE